MSGTQRVGLFTTRPPSAAQRIAGALTLAVIAALTWPVAVAGVGTAVLAVFFSVRLLRSPARDLRVVGVVATVVSGVALVAALVFTGQVVQALISGPTSGSAGTAEEPQKDS